MIHNFISILTDSKGDRIPEGDDNESESELEEALIQATPTQSGGGASKRKNLEDPDEHFISKIAHLVSQKLSQNPNQIHPRPVSSTWSNYDLSPPSTSVMGNVNTTPGAVYQS